MKRTLILSIVVLFVFFQSVHSEIKLPAIVSSNMVLQRNANVSLWGWAGVGETVTIKASWTKAKINVVANGNGEWRTTIKTTNSKAPQTIELKSKESSIVLQNILFGEVWLCSGQSNMYQPINGYSGQPTFGSNMAVAKSSNPNLRLFSVDKVGSKTPLSDVEGCTPWAEANQENVPTFSAVAYFFGSQLQEILDVPVGIIHTSWGGSFVEAWISKEVLSEYQEINLDNAKMANSHRVKTALFNAMIAPLIPFSIKGALWYQGEGNRGNPDAYKELFPAMVKDWRNRWDIGEFPFYYVQIAPFYYRNDSAAFNTVGNSAFIRETQLECLNLIPNSGMAVTMDVGDRYSIHPPKKKEVADRLLFNALNKTYGFSNVDFSGPVYKNFEEKDGGMLLSFDYAETGLYSMNGLSGFEIAGADRVFYPAQAKIVDGRFVFAKSSKVVQPKAVRYAWRNWISGTLYDNNMLPASSFRTDNWDNASLGEE